MRRKLLLTLLLATLGSYFITGLAFAAQITQDFTLESGWNAIFLEVDPVDDDPAAVFAGISDQLVSVYMWNPNTGTVEFIDDPGELIPSHPRYLSYIPGSPILTNLYAIQGNRAYLVETNAAAVLSITGEPLLPAIDWRPNSYNLVGFHLGFGMESTFEHFFSPYPEFQDAEGNLNEIYVLNTSTGQWQQVTPSDRMRKGESFWVYCRGSSSFTGTMQVQVENNNRLDFGKVLSMQDIKISSDIFQQFYICWSSTDVPLYYQLFNSETNTSEWHSFEGCYDELYLAPGESHTLRIGVKRSELTPDMRYETNLRLIGSMENKGTEITIPVSVIGVDFKGLWVGQVTLNQVNEVHSRTGGDITTLKDTGSEFDFRLILHNDGTTTKLLNQVVQVWPEGSPSPILVTEDGDLPAENTLTLRDGRPVGRRISAPAFGTLYDGGSVHAKAMTGSDFGDDGNSLAVDLVLPEDDATNPFVHKYNPEHKVPDGETTTVNRFPITRTITLTFGGGTDPLDGAHFIGWGSSEVGGIYEERIVGLHKDAILMKGTFRLHKASDIGELYAP